MKLSRLILRPRVFFDEQGDSLGWLWPLFGLYLFAFATYFQNHVVPGYRVPFFVVVYVMAWFPTLMVAAALFVLLILLWYWPASMLLGAAQGFEQSTKIVGISLLPPATLLCAVLLLLTVLNSNDVDAPYRMIVAAVHTLAGLWALALIVVGASVSNRLNATKTALFAAWPVVLAALCGIFVYALMRSA